MPEEYSEDSIGGPQPECGSTARVVIETAKTTVIAVGGLLIVALALVPTRAKGATRSAKIKWEQRQIEIQAALNEAALRGELPATTTDADARTTPDGDDSRQQP